MELRHLRYFLAVAQEANVTRAAARLGISQPPLSQQIKELEREVGASLFHRTPQGVVLTEAGVAFQAEAQQIVGSTERARAAAQRAARGETGQLRVGFTGSAAFNPVVATMIRSFRRAWPRVRLTLEEANTTRLVEGLAQQALDAVFLRPGASGLDGIRLRRFADESMKIVLPASHPLSKRRRLPLAALADEPFVLFPRAVGLSLYDAVIIACREAGFEPQLSQEAPQISSVVNLVAAELGVSIVPASIAQVAVRGVRYIDIDGPAPHARLALATRQGDERAVVRNFMALDEA
ncbi:MAG TPA: LysR family transcriptional regulator [Candidatus Aquabacterium excrementipullorum]|nr:LysR family transcriptional regulator [Candidatus Aquabacterium excrementipullorum]